MKMKWTQSSIIESVKYPNRDWTQVVTSAEFGNNENRGQTGFMIVDRNYTVDLFDRNVKKNYKKGINLFGPCILIEFGVYLVL